MQFTQNTLDLKRKQPFKRVWTVTREVHKKRSIFAVNPIMQKRLCFLKEYMKSVVLTTNTERDIIAMAKITIRHLQYYNVE